MFVKEAMTPKAEWVEPNASLASVAKKMREKDIGAIPVGENDRLVGMVTDRDITCRAVAEGRDPSKTDVREVMSKGVTCCFDDQELEEAAHLMEEKQIRRLPVLNSKKRMVGMLTMSDISLKAPHELSGEVIEAVSKHS